MKQKLFGLCAFLAVAIRLPFTAVSATRGGITTPSVLVFRPFAYGAEDAALKASIALPAAASTTVDTAAIDVYPDVSGFRPGDKYEVQVRVPALNATMLPNTRTLTCTLMASPNSDKSSPVAISAPTVLTGAGGVGAAAAVADVRLPLNCPQYIFGRFTTGASTGDMSTVLGTVALKF